MNKILSDEIAMLLEQLRDRDFEILRLQAAIKELERKKESC